MKSQAQVLSSTSIEGSASPQWFRIVRERVCGLRFGTVQIVVHDGRVTQIDSTERTRLSPRNDPTPN